MGLSNYEKETNINFNEDSEEGTIYTHNRALKRKLEKLAYEHSETCKLLKSFSNGGVIYSLPKKWIRISAGRGKLNLTEEQREKRRAIMLENLKKKANRNEVFIW